MKQLAALALALVVIPAAAHADKNYIEGKGGTWDCATDPVVNINVSKGAFTFKGACKEINVNGGGNKVTVAAVETINVNGATNTVTLGEVGSIAVNGDKNAITWKKATTGDKPGVVTNGNGNKVAKAK